MHAIIRQGNGKHYISAVFGYYRDITAQDDYERYIEGIRKPYYIVWDSERKRLIKWLAMTPNTEYLIPQILIIESSCDDWNLDEDGVGSVNFLNREIIDSFIDKEEQPREILEKCRAIDSAYTYKDISEIITSKDVENLQWASGGFHDARIIKEEILPDGTLYLRFGGTWGCEVELWFWGDLEYDTSSRDPETEDPYWLGSTILIQDGFVYLVDDDDMTVDQITKGYCYFKARHMKYRIIPD